MPSKPGSPDGSIIWTRIYLTAILLSLAGIVYLNANLHVRYSTVEAILGIRSIPATAMLVSLAAATVMVVVAGMQSRSGLSAALLFMSKAHFFVGVLGGGGHVAWVHWLDHFLVEGSPSPNWVIYPNYISALYVVLFCSVASVGLVAWSRVAVRSGP